MPFSPGFFPGTSHYLVAHGAKIYGQNKDKNQSQSEYVKQVQDIVSHTANDLRQAVEEKNDLIEVFNNLLISLGTTRKKMAIETKSVNAETFGERIDDDKAFEAPSGLTVLNDHYTEYGKRLQATIQKDLQTMPHTLRSFEQTEKRVIGKECLGRKTYRDISIITYEKSIAYSQFTPEKYKELCTLCEVDPTNERYKSPASGISNLYTNIEAMRKLKIASPDEYRILKLSVMMLYIREKLPKEKKSDWVLVTERCQVDNKMYALTQYITWLYRDFKNDPIAMMTDRSVTSLIHIDAFLVKPMLADIAKIFKQAIECDGRDIKSLQDTIALFLYEFSHAMPFKRGSAAISEWLEMAIYRYHGYDVRYSDKAVINLEALTSSLKDFVDAYPTMIQLEKIISNDASNEAASPQTPIMPSLS